MIERFNFYDVYGYLIPGAILLALLWLPHALVLGTNIPTDLSAAVIAIIFAYVAGHLLQAVANKVIPSTLPVNGKQVYPSELFLEDADPTFPSEFKERLRAKILEELHIDTVIAANRPLAFLMCRNSLIASKTAWYGEQFQGMYVLMRGISAAAAIGCAYDIGWLWSPFLANHDILKLIGFTALAIIIVVYRWELPSSRWSRCAYSGLVLLAASCAGVLGADGLARATEAMAPAALLSLLVALWTFGAYRAFAKQWAMMVYQHFYLLQEPKPAAEEGA